MDDSLIIVFAFILGTIIGSFLNVVGLRLLRDESIIWPASRCFHCDTEILPYDNIPIISWLLLRGRCRHCQKSISLQYPAIELLTGLLFATTVWKFGLGWQFLFLAFLFSNLIIVLITDFKEQYIYDFNSIGLIPFGLAYSYFDLGDMSQRDIPIVFGPGAQVIVPQIFFSAILAVIGAFLIFFLLNLISTLMIGKAGFGEGDSRLLMGIGAFVGFTNMVFIFILSFIIQTAVGIPLLIWAWIQQKSYQTIFYLSGGFILALIPYMMQYWIKDVMILLGISLLLGVGAVYCAVRAIKLAKELPSGLTYLPFGPAIVFSAMLYIFFQDTIVKVLNLV